MSRAVLTFTNGWQTKTTVLGGGLEEYPFEFRTDYLPASGGEGKYPSPWDTFLAALMGCQGTHVYGYLMDKGVSTDNFRLEMNIVYGEDMREVQEFQMDIFLPEDCPPEIRRGALQAARDCKIIRHMFDFSPKFTFKIKNN